MAHSRDLYNCQFRARDPRPSCVHVQLWVWGISWWFQEGKTSVHTKLKSSIYENRLSHSIYDSQSPICIACIQLSAYKIFSKLQNPRPLKSYLWNPLFNLKIILNLVRNECEMKEDSWQTRGQPSEARPDWEGTNKPHLANWLVPIPSNVLHEFCAIRLALSSVGYSLKTAFRRYQFWPESVVWKKRYEGNKREPYIDPVFLDSLHWFPNEWSIPLLAESMVTS